MFANRFFFALFAGIALQHAVHAELLGANDMQTCIDLCSGCDGTATFEGRVCQCHVADDNQQGAECLARLKRQATELGVDLVSCEPANAERPARCLLGTRTNGNPCLVAQYFKNGGPLNALPSFGPFLGALNPNSASDNNVLTAKNANRYPSTPNDTPVGSGNPDSTDGGESRSSTPWERQTVGAANNAQDHPLGNLLGYGAHPDALAESHGRIPNQHNGILGAILAPHNVLGPVQQMGPAGYLQEQHGQGQPMQNNMVGAPDYGRHQDSRQPMPGYVQDQNPMTVHHPAAVAAANPQYAAPNPQYVLIDPMVGAPLGWPYYVVQSPSSPGQANPNGSPDVGAANPMGDPNEMATGEAVAQNPKQSPESEAPGPVGAPKTAEEPAKEKEPEAENVGEPQGDSAESAAEEKPGKKSPKKYAKDSKVGSAKSKKMKDPAVGAVGPDSQAKLNRPKKTKESGNEPEGYSPAEKNKETVSEPKSNRNRAKERDGQVPPNYDQPEANSDDDRI